MATRSGNLLQGVSVASAEMIESVRPSVVVIQNEGQGVGAGVIWRADGGILTNHHVVARNRQTDIRVQLYDGRAFKAKVTGTHPTLDLAMLRIEADDLPAALIGDSAKLRVGELVFAIGHPLGYLGFVTSGIVSGWGTVKIDDAGGAARFIKSDVRLAPGNSGGPLLNARGEVVGVNSMILGGDMSVAIPSEVAAEWLAGQPSRRVKLGVGVQSIKLESALSGITQPQRAAGLLVVNVEKGGLADRSEVMVGDVILDVADMPVENGDSFLRALAHISTRDSAQLRVIRGGALQTLTVRVKPEATEQWL